MNRDEATVRARDLLESATASAEAAVPTVEFGAVVASTSDCFDGLGNQTDQVNVVLDRSAVVAESVSTADESAGSLVEVIDSIERVWLDAGAELQRSERDDTFPGPWLLGEVDGFRLEASYIVATLDRPLSLFVGVVSPCVDQ